MLHEVLAGQSQQRQIASNHFNLRPIVIEPT